MQGEAMQLDFGVFDHLDRGGRAIHEVFKLRMRLVEIYDRAGFYAYHPAEHHSTPLSCAPSPNVLLAAVAQRTTRLRLCPLVYILPMYNPLRLIEELCMLDQMSQGRLEIGVGKGIAPFELLGWGINPLEALAIYKETLEVVLRGLASPNKKLSFKGDYFRYFDVPIEMEPYQKPHPPLWYGVWFDPEAAVWPAQKGCNIVGIINSAGVRPLFDRFRAEWAAHQPGRALPKMGINRTVVVAPTNEQAHQRAKRAHANYWSSLDHLWQRWGAKSAHFPSDYEGALAREMLIIGTPATVRAEIERQAETSGMNYLIARFAYGDMSDEDIDESVRLFVSEVMPHFRPSAARAAAQ
jgi:alkanesulfonate monooxygenase SsuD/methylene tetrahydromethanopterin reductase-like flavin-dependent oxidoreductase (luciferase family)